MDIERLNEFIVLATHLNYSKAANLLFLTQPALSRHIHDLEQTLGEKLFYRDTHNVRLTPVGELFYKEAQDIVERYRAALKLVREAHSSLTGSLAVGYLGAAVEPFLSDFITEFTGENPNIQLFLYDGHLDGMMSKLNSDELDLAFVTHVDSSFFTGLESETILHDRMMAVMHPSHPLASRSELNLRDLADVPCIAFDRKQNPITYEFHRQLFRSVNVPYQVAWEVPNIETAFFYARMKEGFFIIPSHLKKMAAGLSVIPIADPNCTISLNMVWKKSNTNPAIPIFHRELQEFMKRN